MKQICANCVYFHNRGNDEGCCNKLWNEMNHYISVHTSKCELYKCRYIAKGVPIKNGKPRGKDNNKKQLERKIEGDTVDCLLVDKCIVKSESAYDLDGCCYCQFNADAYLQNNFQFNGVGEEPTDEELDAALEYAE